MSAAARLGLFLAAAAALFAAAAAAGRVVGPFERGAAEAEGHGGGHAAPADRAPAGLASAAAGLRLVPQTDALPAGRPVPFLFRIERDGEPLRDYDVEHERRMHLIVVRRDLGAFFHLHPRLRADGSWATRVRLPAAAAYRAFADFSADGERRTLGVDLFAYDGAAPEQPAPAAVRWTYVDGYRVVLLPAERVAGEERPLRFVVMRGRRAVKVEPYLGARGHLVVLREGDLAYLHAHADADELEFETLFPTAGDYRAFLQFRAGGSVHTAAFDVEVHG